MATGDYMYYSDGNNIWPLGQYQPAAGCMYVQPTTAVTNNWIVCPLCSAWYLPGTSHNCTSTSLIPPSREAARIPHKCPCCDGYGEREKRGSLQADTGTIPCVSCGGRGIVFE